MNEKIKELEYQCWEQRYYGPSWFDSEKFAGLIIKECCTQINAQDDGESLDSWDSGFAAGLRCANRAITDYFGVEE